MYKIIILTIAMLTLSACDSLGLSTAEPAEPVELKAYSISFLLSSMSSTSSMQSQWKSQQVRHQVLHEFFEF